MTGEVQNNENLECDPKMMELLVEKFQKHPKKLPHLLWVGAKIFC